jgi:dTDP-4-amino-4,6-dideoxygalactose transaminase
MIKVLIPDMPRAHQLMRALQDMDANKIYVNNGPLVAAVESKFRRWKTLPSAMVSNATVGIELALRSLNLPAGSSVLVPSVTFSATGQAIKNAGLNPVVTDVDEHSWQLTPAIAETYLPKMSISAVIPVAAFGFGVPTAPWEEFYRNTGIPVIIDAAGAVMTQQPTVAGCNIFTVYSLHATKFIGAGEGGLVCHNLPERVALIRSMAAFGPGGTNAKNSEYHAAVALVAMRRSVMRKKVAKIQQVLKAYRRLLNCPYKDTNTLLPVLLPENYSADVIRSQLLNAGIETKQWYAPFLSDRPEFKSSASFPVTDRISQRMLGLPCHTLLSISDVETICSNLAEVLDGGLTNNWYMRLHWLTPSKRS